ncbi:MAG: Radical protein [Dehalococcoidia bacterium]|nr:Radical protein [Dehalococcoidia bacterium]
MVSDAEEVYFEQPPYRPPSESRSLLIRATRGCPWHRCAFCQMYNDTRFEVRTVEEVERDIEAMRRVADTVQEFAQKNGFADRLEHVALHFGVLWIHDDGVKTAFIGDSNSIVMRTEDLAHILEFLRRTFPTIERVTSYGRAHTVLRKSPDDLRRLREAGLSRLHLGLETGDDELLSYINKGVTAAQMTEAGKRVVASGISLSEYVILGLGGKERWEQHVDGTAAVLNAVNPDFIRVRTLMVINGTPLAEKQARGEFTLQTPEGVLKETRRLIEKLEVGSEFVSDHVSNYLNLSGKLPEDRERLLQAVDAVLATPPDARERLLTPENLRHS